LSEPQFVRLKDFQDACPPKNQNQKNLENLFNPSSATNFQILKFSNSKSPPTPSNCPYQSPVPFGIIVIAGNQYGMDYAGDPEKQG